MENNKKEVIRKRSVNVDAVGRHCDTAIHIRIPMSVSKKFASYQGLCYKYGKMETLGELFEQVIMPAMSDYVAKYARKAEIDRLARRKGKGA